MKKQLWQEQFIRLLQKKENELKVICADCGVVLDDNPRKYMIDKGLWKIK